MTAASASVGLLLQSWSQMLEKIPPFPLFNVGVKIREH